LKDREEGLTNRALIKETDLVLPKAIYHEPIIFDASHRPD